VSLILGNAQTQVFFRVSREDAERLSKEAMNIVEQLYERDHSLMQEPEHKFTLNEMWEVAFHNLSRLKAKEAFVMVKGEMDHPERMRTLDNPREPAIDYPYDDRYFSLSELKSDHALIRMALENEIAKFNRDDETGGINHLLILILEKINNRGTLLDVSPKDGKTLN